MCLGTILLLTGWIYHPSSHGSFLSPWDQVQDNSSFSASWYLCLMYFRNILRWSSLSSLSTHNLRLRLLIIAATVTAIVTIRSFGKSDGSESFIIGIGIKRLKYLLLQVLRKSDNGQQNPWFLYLSNHLTSNPLQNFLYN